MLVSPAFAQDSGGGLGEIGPLIPLVLIFVVFYFLLIRPQQKKAKAHREMIAEIRRGDRIVTSGGLIGRVHRVLSDSELMVEVADGVRVRVMRSMVAETVAKPEPRRSRDDDDEDDEEAEDDRSRRRNRRRSKARDEPVDAPVEVEDDIGDDDIGDDDRDDAEVDDAEREQDRDDDRERDEPRRSGA